jgi:hypothetical protein
MACNVALAGAHQVDGLWSQIADGLEHACRKTGGDLTAHYLWTECRSGRAFLVVVSAETIIAASVWRFEQWTTGRKLRCLALYGVGMKDWLRPHRKLIEDLAKVGGATSLVTEGRKGFQRIFPAARVLRLLYEEPLQ